MKQRDLCNSRRCYDTYKKLINECEKKIKVAKSNYYINLIETNKNDPKILTKIFQDLGSKNNRHKSIQKIKIDEKLIECRQTISNVFNQHFTSMIDTFNITSIALTDCGRLSNFVDKNSSPGKFYKIP